MDCCLPNEAIFDENSTQAHLSHRFWKYVHAVMLRLSCFRSFAIQNLASLRYEQWT